MNSRRLIYGVLLLAWSITVQALTPPATAAIPGGIVTLPLPDTVPADAAPPSVMYNTRRVAVVARNGRWLAVIGIPLDTSAGEQKIHVEPASGAPFTLSFSVAPKEYPAQHITLNDQNQVEPSADDLQRIEAEQIEIRRAFAHWSANAPESFTALLPVAAAPGSAFGLRRFFNGQARQPHSGLDIPAPVGTPVQAALAGRVLRIGDYFFNGKTLFLDHGQGLITMYCHLDHIEVTFGEVVSRGQLIATVGKSGRATGPHLHWSVSLNDARVDPQLLLPPSP